MAEEVSSEMKAVGLAAEVGKLPYPAILTFLNRLRTDPGIDKHFGLWAKTLRSHSGRMMVAVKPLGSAFAQIDDSDELDPKLKSALVQAIVQLKSLASENSPNGYLPGGFFVQIVREVDALDMKPRA